MPPTGRARRGVIPADTTGRARQRAVICRATTGRAPMGRHPSGHATRVGRIGCPASAAFAVDVVEPPNYSALAAPLAGV